MAKNKRFVVVVMRPVADETAVAVEAPNAEQAQEKALAMVEAAPGDFFWRSNRVVIDHETPYCVVTTLKPPPPDEWAEGPMHDDTSIAQTFGGELVRLARDVVNDLMNSPLLFSQEFTERLLRIHSMVDHPALTPAEDDATADPCEITTH